MIQLTPEELAACREVQRIWLKESSDPDLPAHMFAAGLSHARDESAKEIADLQQHIDTDIDFIRQYQREIAALKAQVEGMKNVRLNIRHRDCHKAADAFWKYWKENGETHKHGYYEATWGAINSALKVVGVIDTAQEKPNDR